MELCDHCERLAPGPLHELKNDEKICDGCLLALFDKWIEEHT